MQIQQAFPDLRTKPRTTKTDIKQTSQEKYDEAIQVHICMFMVVTQVLGPCGSTRHAGRYDNVDHKYEPSEQLYA